MGFRVAVALCLSLALVANGQIFNDLAAKENQLNCLLGKPTCVSPSPPPTTPPPTTPPPSEAPVPSPSEGPAPTPSEEPSLAPVPAPVPAPAPVVPAPAPGPSAAGTAVAVVSLQFPDTFVVTDQVRQQLVDLIQQQLGSQATVELQVAGGRKLLQLVTFTLLLTDIKDCVAVAFTLEVFIPGSFITEAQGEGIQLQSASLTAYACTYPGEEPYTVSNPPAVAPSAVPAYGPGSSPSGSTPGSSPPGSTPGSSPPRRAPVPAPYR